MASKLGSTLTSQSNNPNFANGVVRPKRDYPRTKFLTLNDSPTVVPKLRLANHG